MRVLQRFVKRAAKLLAMDGSSSHVEASFEKLLEKVREAVGSFPGSLREAALRRMLQTSKLFGPNLFACYDHPDLDRTDNGLEGLFRITRRHERLITGHKSTARRTVREGPFLVTVLCRKDSGPLTPENLARVPEEVWRERLAQIREGRARYDRPREIRTDLDTHLKALVKRCHHIRRSRGP